MCIYSVNISYSRGFVSVCFALYECVRKRDDSKSASGRAHFILQAYKLNHLREIEIFDVL